MLNVVFEDNHLLVLNKRCGELVQGDSTGDQTLADKAKTYLKQKYNKPGKVFLGIPHRLDRPTSGLIVYTRTGKALKRMVKIFRERNVRKSYLAICKNIPEYKQMNLTNYLYKNKNQNKSYVVDKNHKDAKRAELNYTVLAQAEGYSLLEVELLTGRHHQIRVQLSNQGLIIKGDLKYGFPKANPDAGIHLHAREIEFVHPVRKEPILLKAEPPTDYAWDMFSDFISPKN
ncbi:MAG: RluA family pseudouridine synthase [Bacteroidota bacterium]|nr:RluA family pseudouridine synthase [Bacteroidota bacterium]